MYEPNEFQKQMQKDFPEFSPENMPKRDKPLTDAERDVAVKKAYENDI